MELGSGTESQSEEENPPEGSENWSDADRQRREAAMSESKMLLGDQALFNGEEREAMRHYSRAMIDEPNRKDAWIAQIRMMLFNHKSTEADSWIARAITIFPESPEFLSLRQISNARAGRIEEALAKSKKLAEDHPNDLTVLMSRGHSLIASGKRDREEEKTFKKCLDLAPPTDWRTPFLIAMAYESEKLFARSIHYYEMAGKRGDRLPYAWYRAGLIHNKLGQAKAARHAFMTAEFLSEDNPKLRGRIRTANKDSTLGRVMGFFFGR